MHLRVDPTGEKLHNYCLFCPKLKFMRAILLSLSLVSFGAFGQIVGGEMVASGRTMITTTDFHIEGHHSGWAIYTLAVDLEGNVVGAEIGESNLPSRLDKMDVRNYVMKLKFQKGTHYPKLHHVEVKITMDKSENPPELEILIN